MKRFCTPPLFLFLLVLIASLNASAQQVIGSFPDIDGGFEAQTTTTTTGSIATGASLSNWSISNTVSAGGAASLALNTSGGRSGSKYITASNTGSAAIRIQSASVLTNGAIANATSYVVQYYYRTSGNTAVTNFQRGISPDGTGQPGTYVATTMAGTSGVWTLVQVTQTSGTSAAATKYGIGILRMNGATAVPVDVDDYVLYLGPADNTAPNSPGTVTVNGATNTTLNVSWGAASGGTDGGGYVVVRYAVSPNADNDPNQKGIYAVGNTTTNGTGSLTGTVRYVGTGTSFTDNVGLAANTTYYYKVYTVDKAFNYSAETQGSGSTLAYSNPTTTSISPSSANAGGSTFTITVNGTNFQNGFSSVTWNGSPRTTTFISSTQLTATITASDYATAGSANVGVTTTGAISPSNTQTFTINPAGGLSQTITFNPLATKTYGDAPFNPGATASSTLTVSYISSNTAVATVSGNIITIVGPGTTDITASQGGDATYAPATDVVRTLTVNPAEITITGASALDKLFDGSNAAIINYTGINGVVGSDNISVTPGGTFASSSVGSGIAVTAAFTLSGPDAAKYTITQPTGLSASIIAPILAWDFAGKAGNEASVAATTVDPSMNNSSISRGAGMAAAALPNGFSSSNYTVSGTLANAIATNQFFQFTVNAKPGYQVSLSSLDANLRRSSTGPNAYQWKYSLDGFATAGIDIGSPVSFTNTATTGVAQSQINLSSITALQNVATVSTITFRMYPYGATNVGGTFAFGLPTTPVNDIAIGGTISAAPTPDINIAPAHPAAGTADQGSTDVVIGSIVLNVATTNAYLLGASVNTAGNYTASDITNIKFWYNTINSLSGATQLGTTQSPVGSGSAVSVTGLSETFGPGHTTYIIVTASIASTATVGRTIGLASTLFNKLTFASANLTGTNPVAASSLQTITQLDPTVAISAAHSAAGSVLQNGTNQVIGSLKLDVSVTSATLTSLSVATAGTYQVSDIQTNGFKLWINSTNNLTGATQLGTAQPVVGPANLLTVSGLSTNIPNGATRYLIFTADVAYDAVAGRTISMGATAFSSLVFASANTTGTDPASAGNAQTITAVAPSIAIASNGPAAAIIGAPSTNNILYGFSTAVTVNSTDLTGITLKFAGTYTTADFVASSVKLWFGTTNVFANATQIGSGGVSIVSAGNNLVLTGFSQTVAIGTTGYFWVTGDLSASALPGRTINATAPTLASFTFTQGNKTGTPAATGVQTFSKQPTITEIIVPQYIHGTTNKIPYIYRVRIGNLIPNATYRYYNQAVVASDGATGTGAGTIIFPSTSGNFTQTSSGSLSTAGGYSSFTADAIGSYTGWFITESSSNTRFTAGNSLFMRIFLNDGAGGTTIASRVTTTSSVTSIIFATSAGANNATGIRGSSSGTPKDIVLLYDNVAGTGRPLSAAYIESDGFTNSTGYPTFYTGSVDGIAGAWGTVVPNTLANGVRRIEVRSLSTGSISNCPAVSVNGTWPASGLNTVNPAGGSTTVLVVTVADAPLSSSANTWLGVNSNWANAANWVCGIPNSTTADVIIPANAPVMPSLAYTTTNIRNLTFQGAATLDLNGKALVISGNITGATGNLKASVLSDLAISGTATLSLTAGFRELRNLTLNSGANITLGTPLAITSVNNGGTLTVNSGATLNTGGNLTIRSTVNGTGSIGNSAGTINGNVTVERYIPQNAFRAWRLLSVPTTGQTIKQAWQEGQAALANGNPGYGTLITSSSASATSLGFDAQTVGNSLLVYNSATGAWDPVANTTSSMATNAGYMLYIRGDRSVGIQAGSFYPGATTLRTTGTIFQGTQAAISLTAGQNVVVGNRYASAIDFSNLVRSGVTSFKVWDPKLAGTNNAGGFQTFSASNGYDPIPGGGSYTGISSNTRIESGQAFFVNSTGGGSIQLVEAAKVTGSRNVFKTAGQLSQLKTLLYGQTSRGFELTDGSAVTFDGQYADVVDNDDALKVSNMGENLGINNSGKVLSVEARQPVADVDTVHYKTWNLKKAAYRLQFVANNLAQPGLTMMLLDRFTGNATVISTADTTNVDFAVTDNVQSAASDRFQVVFKNNATMPVTFINIGAKAEDGKVRVNWNVANEKNIRSYEVEHAVDGRDFTKAGMVAAQGNAQSTQYGFTHLQSVEGDNYYRVKSIDIAGKTSYSAVVKVNMGKVVSSFVITPNPIINSTINLQFNSQPKGTYAVRLITATGQVLLSRQVVHEGYNRSQSIAVPSGLAVGIYQLEITRPGNLGKSIQKVVVEAN